MIEILFSTQTALKILYNIAVQCAIMNFTTHIIGSLMVQYAQISWDDLVFQHRARWYVNPVAVIRDYDHCTLEIKCIFEYKFILQFYRTLGCTKMNEPLVKLLVRRWRLLTPSGGPARSGRGLLQICSNLNIIQFN